MAKAPKSGSSTVARVRTLKARFDAIHSKGMAALKRHDYGALDEAIRREGEIITEQGALIDEQGAVLREEQARLASAQPKRKRAQK